MFSVHRIECLIRHFDTCTVPIKSGTNPVNFVPKVAYGCLFVYISWVYYSCEKYSAKTKGKKCIQYKKSSVIFEVFSFEEFLLKTNWERIFWHDGFEKSRFAEYITFWVNNYMEKIDKDMAFEFIKSTIDK